MFDYLEDFGFNHASDAGSNSSDEEGEDTDLSIKMDNTLNLLKQISLERRESSNSNQSGAGSSYGRRSSRAFQELGLENSLSHEVYTGLLTEDNIEDVIAGTVKLNKNACIRLRVYKLFKAIVQT